MFSHELVKLPLCYHHSVDDIGRKWQKKTGHYSGRSPEVEITAGAGKTIELPAPGTMDTTLAEALAHRRSGRNFDGRPLTAEMLASLLWAAYGVNAERGRLAMRTAPSAGATYPVELHVVVNACQEVQPGLYRYDGPDHRLVDLALGDVSGATAAALLDQSFVANAAAVLVWTAVTARCERRYQQRAYRYIYLEAGHQAQNVLLAAVAMGLVACPVGAFFDDELSALLGLDGAAEIPLYAVSVGHPSR